jgi:MerR family mercuric resistance operon transcriptional regulator
MQDGMTIGKLAKAACVNVETIRYYQRRGLIGEPSKPMGGQRRYPSRVVNELGFIRRAQQLGFSLEEVKSLLKLADGSGAKETRALAERKLVVMEARAKEINAMRRKLKALIAASRKAAGRGKDPIIVSLQEDDE